MEERILEQFATTQGSSAAERLIALQQEGTVREYIRDFKALASNAPEFTERMLEIHFMRGLQQKIRKGIRLLEPRTLEKMMTVAKRVEDWESEAENTSTGAGSKASTTKPLSDRGYSYSHGSQLKGGSGPVHQTSKPNNIDTCSNPQNKNRRPNNKATTTHFRLKPPFRRLTPTEMAKWRAEGLCYKCDEKHFADHICKSPELTVLIAVEDGTKIECTEEQSDCVEGTKGIEEGVAELSAISVVGLSSP